MCHEWTHDLVGLLTGSFQIFFYSSATVLNFWGKWGCTALDKSKSVTNMWQGCTREPGGLKIVLLCLVKCFKIFRKRVLLESGESQGREYLSPTSQSISLWFHRSLVFAKFCYPDREFFFFLNLPLIFACVGYSGQGVSGKKNQLCNING